MKGKEREGSQVCVMCLARHRGGVGRRKRSPAALAEFTLNQVKASFLMTGCNLQGPPPTLLSVSKKEKRKNWKSVSLISTSILPDRHGMPPSSGQRDPLSVGQRGCTESPVGLVEECVCCVWCVWGTDQRPHASWCYYLWVRGPRWQAFKLPWLCSKASGSNEVHVDHVDGGSFRTRSQRPHAGHRQA